MSNLHRVLRVVVTDGLDQLVVSVSELLCTAVRARVAAVGSCSLLLTIARVMCGIGGLLVSLRQGAWHEQTDPSICCVLNI
jgi:hypothetical protein